MPQTKLSELEIFLLTSLCRGKRALPPNAVEHWDRQLQGFDRTIAKFIKMGFIREAPDLAKLSDKYTVNDLKKLLAERGLSTKGRKATLVQTVMEHWSAEEFHTLISDVRLYHCTSKGRAYVEQANKARDEAERKAMLKESTASNRQHLAGYKKAFREGIIKGVEILAANDSCPACKALTGIVYHPDGIPQLPFKGCTHPIGWCRCRYVAVVDDPDTTPRRRKSKKGCLKALFG